MSTWRHVFLLSSLPRLAGLDAVRSLPIGESTLRDRLSVLGPEQLAALATVESLLQWPAGWSGLSEAICLARLRDAARDMPHAALRHHCAERLQTVAVLGALRVRRRGASVAPDWLRECGQIGGQMTRHWSDLEFGLAASHPWLGAVTRQFAAADWDGLERALIRREYAALAATQSACGYGFESVTAYVLRWRLMVRWLAFDASRAAQRLAVLLNSILATAEPLRGN